MELAEARNEDRMLSILKRRAKPRVVLLDQNLSIAFAQADAITFLSAYSPAPHAEINRLPAALEAAVRHVLALWVSAGRVSEEIVAPLPSVLLRVSRLDGPTGSFVAVFLEEHSRREDLASAGRRFSLTRRELQVLSLILAGASAGEIATQLHIAETTVSGYFKSLLRKTEAKNRADMLAKILGWDGSDRAGSPPGRRIR